jgi:hypothetical protein
MYKRVQLYETWFQSHEKKGKSGGRDSANGLIFHQNPELGGSPVIKIDDYKNNKTDKDGNRRN